MSERPEPRKRRWRFQFSLAALISLVIFANLGFAIYYTWELYRFPPPIRTFKGHAGFPAPLAFSPDSRRLLSSSPDKTIRLWDVESGKEIRQLVGAKGGATTMVFSSDGRRALTGAVDGVVRLWDLETGREIRQFAEHTNLSCIVALSPDGRMAIAAGIIDKSIFVWDVESGELLRKLTVRDTGAQSVAFSSDGRRALAMGLSTPGMGLSPTLTSAQLADSYYTIHAWEIESGREIVRLVGKKFGGMPLGKNEWIIIFALSPDGWRAIMSGSNTGDLMLWDLKNDRKIRDFIGHKKWAGVATFSMDGKLVMSSSEDQTFRLWDVESGREIGCLGTRHFYPAVLSPDGKLVVSSAMDGTIKLWDLQRKPNIWPFILAVSLTAVFTVFVAVMKFYVRSGERAMMLAVAEWMRARRKKR